MKALRAALGVIVIGALTLGGLASLRAYFSGEASTYAASVDRPEIASAALALFVASIALFLIRDRSEDSPQQ